MGGTTTSFSNTPQAADDFFTSVFTGLTEDSFGTVFLNVMANDLGGNAKSLWSVDNGTNNTGAMSGYIAADLLTQDLGRIESASSDTSANGAKIWITADGKVGYDTAYLSAAFRAQLQGLNAGQYLTDTFIYSIRLGNGTLSWATATIQFAGTNDAPVLSDTSDPVAVLEAGNASAQNLVAITGNFSVTDLDIGDTLHASVVGSPVVQLNGSPFSLPAGAAALIAGSAFTLTDTTSNGGAVNIGYSYDPTAANLDFLGAGQSLTITYTVQVNDGTTNSGTQNVTFTITGTNDAPVLSDTSDPVAVLEAGNASAQNLVAITGNFSVSDLDVGDTLHASVVGSPVVQLNGSPFSLPAGAAALIAGGAFTLTDTTSNGGAVNIGYSYDPSPANLDFLGAGQSLTITYTVQVNDGTTNSGTQNVTFTVTGTNDAPVLSDTSDPVAMLEAGNASAQNLVAITGNFSVSDLDVGDTLHASVVGSPVVQLNGSPFSLPAGAAALTAGGAFTLTDTISNGGAANIGYSYDPSPANLDFLGAGQSLTITYTVLVNDGTTNSGTQNVTFTITGTNDAPLVAATDVTGAVTEQVTPVGNLTDTGTIAFTDVDLTDAHSISPTITASAGALGALTASVTTDTTGSGLGGVVTWNYSVADSDVEYLAKDQTKVETFTITLDDGNGGTVDRTVSVTITGTNDAPLVAATDVTGAVTEQVTPVG
ncbi:VCBS domain-containing protein, partial [Mesorhizobium sp. M1050]|uniref:VCBS domain-containing protein n=1 Tax=Mesorhizobium sp. M1050 TaxID=2957051 RepID=UPI0033362839